MLARADYATWKALLDGVQLPAAVIDLDALDHNLDVLLSHCKPGVTIRLASKSIRCLAILERLAERGGDRVRGVMTYHVAEGALLAGHDRLHDMLHGYPIGRPADADAIAAWWADNGDSDARFVAMIDSAEHVKLLADAAARARDARPDLPDLPVCIDVDVSLRPVGGVHLGVRRSPVRGPEDALAVARSVRAAAGLEVVGVMAYEAQVAGMPDRVPGEAFLDPIRGLIKSRSRKLAAQRRNAVVDALRADGFTIELVNGGGTGSVRSTSHDGSVTEVTAGSGFYCPTLFDNYDDLDLQPSAFFVVPVVRTSDPGYVTCGFGGFIASGPTDASRAPTVHLPDGVQTLGMEGFGEVQTPLKCSANAPAMGLGDPVVLRHAKSGELLAHFEAVHLVQGGRIIDTVSSYPRFFR